MALATAEAIRDRIYNLIEALTPTTDATKFRRYRNEWGADFIAAAEANPAAMLRRFQVREIGDDEPPITTGVIEERVTVRYQVLIAYPQSHRYGRDSAADRDDVMNEDWKAINYKVGIYGKGNFSTTTAGSYDATPLGAVRDMERGEGVDLLVIDAPFEFWRATGVESAADPAPTWSVDATSGIAAPADATEWDAFITANSLAIDAPDSLYLLDEASGSLVDVIGSIDLAAAGTVAYEQVAAGWSRPGVKTTNGTAGRWSSTDAALPDISASSCMVLFFAITAAASSNKVICEMGTTVSAILINSTTPNRFRVISAAGSAASTTNDVGGAVRPFVLRERVDVPSTTGFTDQEKLSPTHGAVTGKRFVLGGISTAPADTTYLYAARWDGAKAEVSDADVKALLEAMGWTVSWS